MSLAIYKPDWKHRWCLDGKIWLILKQWLNWINSVNLQEQLLSNTKKNKRLNINLKDESVKNTALDKGAFIPPQNIEF